MAGSPAPRRRSRSAPPALTTLPPQPSPLGTSSSLLISPIVTRASIWPQGFQNPDLSDTHLQTLAENLPTRDALATFADTLLDALADSANPHTALTTVTHYLAARTTARSFLGSLKDNPRAAQNLAQLMSASPSLGEILIRNPEYLHWLQLGLKRTFPLSSTVS